MTLQSLFERDIFRPINGVVKADQLDIDSVWQELDEFVVTKELLKHLNRLFSLYSDSIDEKPGSADTIGIWMSGYFGSGKSHFLKVLSYLLSNRSVSRDGTSKNALSFIEEKIPDPLLMADIRKAVTHPTDIILFNIDNKADNRTGRDALLGVFLRVFNELQGYCGDYPHIAHLERYLDAKRKLAIFHKAFEERTGSAWVAERDAWSYYPDAIADVLTEVLEMSEESAKKWIDGAEDNFVLTIENFCKWVRDYLDSKGDSHRLIFLVDEVGQYIGTDSHLMLSMQTITEELGTVCGGRVWVVVTSQEDIDSVIGEMRKSRANDFSKITDRFDRFSLSGSNVDEVIQSRLLKKRPDVLTELQQVYQANTDILKHQLSFIDMKLSLKSYSGEEDFVCTYPFAPYQFTLVQKVFEAIRKVGASGLHLSRGERSMLDAFQTAAKAVAVHEVGSLVPLHRFYASIESYLDTAVKRTIDQATDNPALENPFDVQVLQMLFLIRYVDGFKSTIDNFITLCVDHIDADRIAIRRALEDALHRLEGETLVSRNGDQYFFLTDEERDVKKEIKSTELGSGEEARLMGDILFTDVLRDQRKYRYPENKMDFSFNRRCDFIPIGNQIDGGLTVSVISPMHQDYEMYDEARCIFESTAENGQVVIRLENDVALGRELRTYLQSEKYIRRKNDGSLSESTSRILRDVAEENRARRARIVASLEEMTNNAAFFVAGVRPEIDAPSPTLILDKAFEYLVRNTFSKMSYLRYLTTETDRLKQIQAILRSNDPGQEALGLDAEEGNGEAIEELKNYIDLASQKGLQLVVQDMLEKKFSLRPYGWPDEEVLILLARLMITGHINLMSDGAIVTPDKAYDLLATSARRRKVLVLKSRKADPVTVQTARSVGKQLFAEMGPDGEDALADFLREQFSRLLNSLGNWKVFSDSGEYPGKTVIDSAISRIRKVLAQTSGTTLVEAVAKEKDSLLEIYEGIRNVQNFYEHQRPTWDKLRKAYERFAPNELELASSPEATAALDRIRQILVHESPFAFLKEVDVLIPIVEGANESLLGGARLDSETRIRSLIDNLKSDLAGREQDSTRGYLTAMEDLLARIPSNGSVAHLSSLVLHAQKIHDDAVAVISATGENENTAAVRKQRIIKPASLAGDGYIETVEQADRFLEALRKEMEDSLRSNERIQIR